MTSSVRLHHTDCGQGPPVLILHGLFGSSDNWAGIARRLSGQFRVLSVDLRNHGRSPSHSVMNYQVMAQDLALFLAEQGIGSAVVVGHSMGGKAAMELSLCHPGLVERLAVVDIAPKVYPLWHQPILDALVGLDLAPFQTRREVEQALAGPIPDLAVRQFLLKSLRQEPGGAWHWRLGLEGIRSGCAALAGDVSAAEPFGGPSVFITGGRSEYVLPGDLAVIRARFPRAVMEVIEGAGHWVQAEAPDRFCEVLNRFLRQ